MMLLYVLIKGFGVDYPLVTRTGMLTFLLANYILKEITYFIIEKLLNMFIIIKYERGLNE